MLLPLQVGEPGEDKESITFLCSDTWGFEPRTFRAEPLLEL